MRRLLLSLPLPLLILALSLGLAQLPASAQMTSGRDMKDFDTVFKLDADRAFRDIKVLLTDSGEPLAIVYPGEQAELRFQIQNRTSQPIKATGQFELIHFGTRGQPGNMWVPEVVAFAELAPIPVTVDLAPGGWQDVTVRPAIPATFGGYALVLDLGTLGRDFVASVVRGPKPTAERIQYPKQSLDGMAPEYLERLGAQAIRFGWSYTHSKDPSYAKQMEELAKEMAEMQKHRITVVMEFGAGRYDQVFGGKGQQARSHLDEEGNQMGGKGDMAWMPKDDPDFEEYVYTIASTYGWPKGPITGFMLWNEPWEGRSISGWGADMLRYREIYEHMGKATLRARADANVDVLIGGCDSSSNSWDKLFPDGKDTFMPYYDFCSIHYQGMSSPALYREWVERKEHKGRVLIWDTESWVANTDDRIAGVIATNRAAGYDRSLGVFYGYLCTALSHGRTQSADVYQADGSRVRTNLPEHAWPAAAAFLAAQVYIGERDFKEIVYRQGLPWVYAFDGLHGNADDGTVVVVGDIGMLFNPDRVLYSTVRSTAGNAPEVRQQQAELKAQIATETDRKKKAALEVELSRMQALRDATMLLDAKGQPFSLFDFYGNQVPAKDGVISIPLDSRGYFLRADPTVPGSFAKLLQAVKDARILGLEPVELVPLDLLAPIDQKPTLRVQVANMLNRTVTGTLAVKAEGLQLAFADGADTLTLAPGASVTVAATVVGGTARSDNTYPIAVTFTSPDAGVSELTDIVRVNRIHHRTITVDGNLDDWRDALPQIIQTDEAATRTMTEAAWLPFEGFDAGDAGGFAAGYLAYDADYFYFAAKVADSTPHPGTLRFATRDDDAFFYPPVAYHTEEDGFGMPVKRVELVWPEGVRRYTYRTNPILPSTGQGPSFDNIQIAFNAIPYEEEADWVTNLPGRMPKFIAYKCTDYEYALNTVAPEYGGGTEVWRLSYPGLVRKHFYPRQPKHPLEGAVEAAKLVTVYRDGARFTEAAIPWAELPDVKRLLDAGQTVKFSYAVNSDRPGPCMELARKRAVSRMNPAAFHTDWREHWANELEFSFEKEEAK